MQRDIRQDFSADTSDAELIDACLRKDAAAWEALIRRYQSLIYSVPIKYRFTAQDASDIFQTVCIVLMEKLKTLRHSSGLSSWIYTTTKRQCWKLAKKRARESELKDIPELAQDPESADHLVLQHQLRLSLDQLTGKCRRLLEALYFTDPPRSYQQIADELGIPVGSVGPTRARCLENLRKRLAREK